MKKTTLSVLAIAQIAHEVNKAYCEAIGDYSQPEWADAPDWQKNSALNGVRFDIGFPDITPEDSHNSWLEQKVADGWEYGEVKDADMKTHPCIVPYAELPEKERVKDHLFTQVVKSLTV